MNKDFIALFSAEQDVTKVLLQEKFRLPKKIEATANSKTLAVELHRSNLILCDLIKQMYHNPSVTTWKMCHKKYMFEEIKDI